MTTDTPLRITIYTRPACGECKKTLTTLTAAGVPFTCLPADEHLDHIIRLGYGHLPVVQVHGGPERHWCGHQPHLLQGLIAEVGHHG